MSNPPRIGLAQIPTPLERAEALSRRLGVELYFKRDDLTGLALGGNKARKLEYYLGDAVAKGADTLVTFGGVQSNHARMTAAAAAKCGLGSHLILAGTRPRDDEGNLLLDRLLGAELEFLGLAPAELTAARVERAFEEAGRRLRAQGRRPYAIPAGGSAPLGVLAYALAFRELMDQAARQAVQVETVVVAFGTGGTLAGLCLGNILLGRPARLLGVSVAPPGMPGDLGIPSVRELVAGALPLVESLSDPDLLPPPSRSGASRREDDVEVDYSWSGPAYGAATSASAEAIRLVARDEGILLDPVYTGKAMAGLMDRARRKSAGASGAVVFVHTGGSPALFPYAKSLIERPPGEGTAPEGA